MRRDMPPRRFIFPAAGFCAKKGRLG